MITLKADNRDLLTGTKYSYLNTNYASGVTSIVLVNSNGFAADDYILLGNFGSETAEIVQISTVTAATHTLALGSATKFAHAESTKITILKYNKVRFYRTTTTTFATTDPVTDYIDVQADDFYTKAYDTTTVNVTNYGWFVFYNTATAKETTNSNAIPYAGFAENSVRSILDSFFSLLNNKELKLITNVDAFSWLNEGYAIAQNELNLVNREYNVADNYSLSIEADTKEYALPDDFGDMLSLTDDDEEAVEFISLDKVGEWDGDTANEIKYYLRGGYIGFSPTPTSATTLTMKYVKKTTRLTSYYDAIDFPDNNFYCLKDYMLFRAAPKLNRGDGIYYYNLFMDAIKRMKVTSIKRDEHKHSWDIQDEANI